VMSGAGDIESAVNAMRLGALDFLVKPFTQRALFEKIDAGFKSLDQRAYVREAQNDNVARFARLTEREMEVLLLLIEGCANRQISEKLGLSVRTVETYRGKLMDKLGVGSLPEAIRLAYATGIVTLAS
jgi:two-component system, LuxR family, response regulator FixJ